MKIIYLLTFDYTVVWDKILMPNMLVKSARDSFEIKYIIHFDQLPQNWKKWLRSIIFSIVRPLSTSQIIDTVVQKLH